MLELAARTTGLVRKPIVLLKHYLVEYCDQHRYGPATVHVWLPPRTVKNQRPDLFERVMFISASIRLLWDISVVHPYGRGATVQLVPMMTERLPYALSRFLTFTAWLLLSPSTRGLVPPFTHSMLRTQEAGNSDVAVNGFSSLPSRPRTSEGVVRLTRNDLKSRRVLSPSTHLVTFL